MPGDKEPVEHRNGKRIVWPQWLAALAVCQSALVSGLTNGWASPYLAQLTSPEAGGPLRLTDGEASWVASLVNLGRLFGALLGAICQEIVGRKRTLLIGGLPLASSWVFSICSTSVTWLYASRFCSGIGSGIMWPAMSLYLGEIADPSIRGSLISMNVNAASVGTFLGNVMGAYLSMEMFAYVSLVPNILFLVLFSLIPESPYHYILRDDIDKAEASLKWFRREADVKTEMRELQDFVDGARTNILVRLKQFARPENLKRATMMVCLNLLVYMTGYSTINSYSEIIVTKSGVSLTPSVVVMCLGFSTVVAGATAVLVVDRLGRRRLLMVSSLGAAASLGLLGLHFHLLTLGFDGPTLTWLPVTSLLTFSISVSYGLVPVPSTFTGELFPANLKNLASFLLGSANALLSFASARSYQPYLDLVGDKYVFWTYALVALVAVPYTYYVIPETKGQSLLQIQNAGKR